MKTLLTITQAGRAKQQDPLGTGAAVPKIETFLLGAGPVSDTPHLVTAMTAWHEAPVYSFKRPSPGAVEFTCHLGGNVEGRIREIALMMADGTIYAYGAFQEEIDGFFKPANFTFTFSAVIADEDAGNLDVTYAALDITALGAEIAAEANARISAESGAFQIATIRSFSAGNRVAFEQQKQINMLEARK